MSAQINDRMMDTDDLCDTEWMRKQFDPRIVWEDADRKERARGRIAMHEDVIYKLNEQGYMYGVNKVERLAFKEHFEMNREFPKTLYWYFTMYPYALDWCHNLYTNSDQNTYSLFFEDCAIAHINERWVQPGQLPDRFWWDASDL